MTRSIIRLSSLTLLLLSGSTARGQEPQLVTVLRFEEPTAKEGETLGGWYGGPAGTIHFDSTVVHSGNGAARLERDAHSPSDFSTITMQIPIDFDGEWLELSGFLRTELESGWAGLWMREDGPAGVLRFDNMQNRGVRDTTDWTEYNIRLPLDSRAGELFIGVLVAGEGTVWADDLQLLVDDAPITEAPARVIEQTILDTDTEFVTGSGINVSSLTETQIQNVAVLGIAWGFLKYYHPRVASGELHWDYELFRVLPRVLDAGDSEDLNRILAQWVDELGVPEACDPCASDPEDPHLLPRLEWIRDTERIGSALSLQLQSIHKNRSSGDGQFFVTQTPNVGNPVFDHELAYESQRPPDAGYRILALLRLWNIVEYWFPYRDQIDDDWYAVLREFLPRLVAAEDWDTYRLELLALIAHIRDTHANLWSELDVRPPRGDCYWPIALRFIEDHAVVAEYTDERQGRASGLEIGDVIEAVDGRTVESLVESWSPYYAASNWTTQLRDIARFLPRGECGASTLTVESSGQLRTVTVNRTAEAGLAAFRHDRPGETFQLLSGDVAYLKLSSVRIRDIAEYLERAAGTRGLVIDIRNYPSEFVVFALGTRLVQEPTPFARFTVGDLDNPGAFTWTEPLRLQPQSPGYTGKVAVLVDEISVSQAEYTAMAFRVGPQAVVVGSKTAGADGNVSPIPLPGGMRTMISGIGVFYPDKTPTQRVGIIPDIVATATIEGIRDGRDEVLEEALWYILGPDVDEETIRRMARRH